MICPICECRHVDKTYCPRERKYVWRCMRCGNTWSMKNDYGYGHDDYSDSDD